MSRLVYERKSQMIPRPSCYCCKLPMVIERNKSHEDILYFDKHFYHRDCYLGMKKIRKKCYCCSEEMELEQNDENVLFYKQHYYHKNCFVNWCNEKKTVARKNASANIEKYVDAATTAVQELFEKKNVIVVVLPFYRNRQRKEFLIGLLAPIYVRSLETNMTLQKFRGLELKKLLMARATEQRLQFQRKICLICGSAR